jgi:hypothetical protein
MSELKLSDEQKKSLTNQIVKAILDDVTDRRGWRHAWDQFDDDIKIEIEATWKAEIDKILTKVKGDNTALLANHKKLVEALTDVLNGNDIAFNRNQSLASWPDSAFRKQADAALLEAKQWEEK